MPVAAPNRPRAAFPPAAPGGFTYLDLEQLTQKGLHYELIKGVLREMVPPGGQHGGTTMSLSTYLNFHIITNMLGRGFTAETGFLLTQNPDTVLAPDFAYLSTKKLSGPDPRGYIPLVPDLILETCSPRDTQKSAEAKIAEWLGFGVPVCLEMNPPKCILRVYRTQPPPPEGQSPVPDAVLGINDTLTLPDVLPGFSLELSKVFHNIAP